MIWNLNDINLVWVIVIMMGLIGYEVYGFYFGEIYGKK